MNPNYVDPSLRTTYSSYQLAEYFDTIGLPQKYRSSPVLASPSKSAANTPEGLEILSKIIRYQICSIPWENLDLHYSTHHSITLDPLHLLHKMVGRGTGRGGYCMENTLILATVMRSLGFEVMTTGARVNEAIQPRSASKDWTGPKYDGLNHMVTIVTIQSKRYLVDVGFGSNGPSYPVPLEDSYTGVNVKPAHSLLLKHEHIPDNTSRYPEQLLWVYYIRFNDEMPWLPGYCFSEVEFLPRDFGTMNFFVSKSSSSWFTFSVVALKFLMDESTEDIIGDITLFGNEIKERRNGKSKELVKIESESDRVAALEKYLGIKLTQPERNGINGMITMLG